MTTSSPIMRCVRGRRRDESDKNAKWPELTKAPYRAKVTGATLVVAKLDRLSRSVAFLSSLQEAGAKFVAADLPEANQFTVHIMAAGSLF